MEITYSAKKLKNQLTDPKKLLATYGIMARKINQRLKELGDADNLGVFRFIPAARCHELSGNYQGYLAVDISYNYRLIFQPTDDPLPQIKTGELDWSRVTKIQIHEIKDYH